MNASPTVTITVAMTGDARGWSGTEWKDVQVGDTAGGPEHGVALEPAGQE